MSPGQLRLELGLSTVSVAAGHLAVCPDVDPLTCASQTIPAHRHAVETRTSRARLGLGLGLGHGLQLSASLPAERRDVAVDYRTLDGSPYVPPYGDIHHRDEVLSGLADGELRLAALRRSGPGVWMGEGGLTLPFGRTEADPYAAAAAGRWHEHNQLGAGRPVFLLGGAALRPPAPWGALATVSARLSAFTNAEGFRAPHSATVALGASRRLGDRGAVAQLAVEGLVEGAETWSGEAQGGRQALLLDPGLELRMGPHLSGQLDLRWPIVEHLAAHAHDDEGTLRVGPQVALSLAWTGRP